MSPYLKKLKPLERFNVSAERTEFTKATKELNDVIFKSFQTLPMGPDDLDSEIWQVSLEQFPWTERYTFKLDGEYVILDWHFNKKDQIRGPRKIQGSDSLYERVKAIVNI